MKESQETQAPAEESECVKYKGPSREHILLAVTFWIMGLIGEVEMMNIPEAPLYITAATTPTAMATRPPWTLMTPAPLEGAEVDWEAAEAEVAVVLVLEEPDVVVADRVLELLSSVVVAEEVSEESVAVRVVDAVREPLEVLPVAEAVDADPVAVPVAPVMPKLGEKLMLLGFVSSMISMVYWNEFTSSAGGI